MTVKKTPTSKAPAAKPKRKRSRKQTANRPPDFQDKNLLAKISEPAVDPESHWLEVDKLPTYLRRVVMMPCWTDVEVRLMHGEPVANLARYIHEVRGQASWLGRVTLIKYLTELRNAAPIVDRLGVDNPGYRKKLQDIYGDRFAEMDSLAELKLIQRERVMTLVAEERITGQHNPETKHEMVLMKAILRDMVDLKKELGIAAENTPESAGVPIETVNRIREKYGDKAAQTLLNPASQGRILAAVKLAYQAAGVAGLDTRRDYRQPEEEGTITIDVASERVVPDEEDEDDA